MEVSNIMEEPDSRIKKWLEQFNSFRQPIPKTKETNENQVNVAAYYLSLEKKSYDALCWILAEKILKKIHPIPAVDEIRNKAVELAKLGKT
ncbi:MAG: hypothetical protein ACW972_09260, partial [Promethearchaeota archaeon]